MGPDLINVGLRVGEIELVIIRIGFDIAEDTVEIGSNFVKIKLKNIVIRFVNEGEPLVKIGIRRLFHSRPCTVCCRKGVRDIKEFLKGVVGRLWTVVEVLDS